MGIIERDYSPIQQDIVIMSDFKPDFRMYFYRFRLKS